MLRHYEKATNFEKIFQLTFTQQSQNKWEIFLIFVAFSKILNITDKWLSEALILHQLTHNMTTDCSLNHQFSTWKFQAQNMLCTQIGFLFLFWYSEQFMYTTRSDLGIFMYWTGDSMNNLLSYCVLVELRISASEKYLPVYTSGFF